jgi:hypothetical protein
MSKLTRIINSDDYTMLHIHYLRNMFDKYFNIVEYDLTATYDSRAIAVTNCLNKNQTWYTRLNIYRNNRTNFKIRRNLIL